MQLTKARNLKALLDELCPPAEFDKDGTYKSSIPDGLSLYPPNMQHGDHYVQVKGGKWTIGKHGHPDWSDEVSPDDIIRDIEENATARV